MTTPPQHSAPPQGLFLKISPPFLTGMAKGSLPMMCGEAIKFWRREYQADPAWLPSSQTILSGHL